MVAEPDECDIERDEETGAIILEEHFDHEFVACCGCGHVSMRRTYWVGGQRANTMKVTSFPPPVSRRIPDWLTDLNFHFMFSEPQKTIKELFKEIYSAMYADNLRLALMGSRAILDVVLTDKLGDVGGFKQKLDEAVEKGWITTKQKDVIEASIDAGNAAAHRAYKPTHEQLTLVLDIVENTVQSMYVLDSVAKAIKKTTPPRKTKV